MSVQPQEIRRVAGEGVDIRWRDGIVHHLSNHLLRSRCPCAECRERRGDGESHARPLTAGIGGGKKKGSLLRIVEHEQREEVDLQKIWGVGNYALGMAWGDGHSSGIYTFHYLRELGEEIAEAPDQASAAAE